jgi:signal transduction histidine kinase
MKLQGGTLVGEAYMPNLRGGKAYLHGTAATLYDSKGNIVGAIESIRDITEHKHAEEELQKAHDELDIRVRERTAELETRNAEMERFIYTVSHELRSPLISASGFAGFLRQDLEKGEAKRTEIDLMLIEGAMTKMDQLLGEILELSRIGRVANPPEDVPFNAIVKDALDQETETLKSRGVEVSIANDLPIVHVNRMRIAEVLVNLIENSIKYMGNQAHPKIEIDHRKDEEEIVFFVRDNGVGIEPSQHEKVFGLFYKVDGKSDGTGVGLALVKRIIEVHGAGYG